MANQSLTTSRNDQLITAALDIIRRTPVEPDYLKIQCFCARSDWPYILRYEALPDGSYRRKDSVKTEYKGSSDPSPVANTVQSKMISFSKMGGIPPCAWCGDKELTYCEWCDYLVCNGRKIGKIIHCRKSCGSFGESVPIKEIPAKIVSQPSLASIRKSQRSLPSTTQPPSQRSIAAPAPKLLCSSNRSK